MARSSSIPNLREKIHECIAAGMSYKQITKLYGVSKGTISYHSKRIGDTSNNNVPRTDWADIQKSIDAGLGRYQILRLHNLGNPSFMNASANGCIDYTPRSKYKFMDIQDGLTENSTYKTKELKKRLVQESLLDYVCAECGLDPEWNGKKLVLALDHINGTNNDNRLSNLRFLCPNCHSQTDTFAGRNVARKNLAKYNTLPDGVNGNTPFSENG